MILTTNHLLMRPWQVDDAAELYKLARDPEVGPAAGWQPHTSVDESRKLIENILMTANTFAIIDKNSGALIGSIGLHNTSQCKNSDTHDIEIGFWIGKNYWGKGLIPEAVYELQHYAFMDLGYEGMWAAYFDENKRSKRVQEKCGFSHRFTEYDNTDNQLGIAKTVHFTYISKDDWLENFYKGK